MVQIRKGINPDNNIKLLKEVFIMRVSYAAMALLSFVVIGEAKRGGSGGSGGRSRDNGSSTRGTGDSSDTKTKIPIDVDTVCVSDQTA